LVDSKIGLLILTDRSTGGAGRPKKVSTVFYRGFSNTNDFKSRMQKLKCSLSNWTFALRKKGVKMQIRGENVGSRSSIISNLLLCVGTEWKNCDIRKLNRRTVS
jgi:hypothetical protein